MIALLSVQLAKNSSGFRNIYIIDLQELQDIVLKKNENDLFYIYGKEYKRIKNKNNNVNILEMASSDNTISDLIGKARNNIQFPYCTYFVVSEITGSHVSCNVKPDCEDATAEYSTVGRFITNSEHNKRVSVYKFYPSAYDLSSVSIDNDSLILNRAEQNRNTFEISGIRTQVFSRKSFYISDKNITIRIRVKNTGDETTQLYVGYEGYSQNRKRLNRNNYPYKNDNTVLSIVSATEGENFIIVDKYPEWAKNCTLALDAEKDMSDIPNRSFVNGLIVDVQEMEDGYAKIILNSDLDCDLHRSGKLRVHGISKAYIYTNRYTLPPKEEIELTSVMRKNNGFSGFSSRYFSRDVYYVKPILLSYSTNSKANNSIVINDFRVELSNN